MPLNVRCRRVARWFFQTKNPNLGKFGRDLDFKMFEYFMAILEYFMDILDNL
jgi:hypothetical protein